MPWVKEVPAIVQAWYLGTECGNAIASILAGDVNPSGKLPMTFPVSLTDVGAHTVGDYPGTPRNDGSEIVDCNYFEGIYVGYRWNAIPHSNMANPQSVPTGWRLTAKSQSVFL